MKRYGKMKHIPRVKFDRDSQLLIDPWVDNGSRLESGLGDHF